MTRPSPSQVWIRSGYDPAYEPDEGEDEAWTEQEDERAIDAYEDEKELRDE